jgi:TetR/AcrR family transcriptional regulator, ethionamide resistance regulator
MSETKLEKTRRRNDPRDFSILRKSERTRQNILDTALKFLWSNSFRDMTVAGLTTRAGISRPCFYQYFADLHSLMEDLLKDLEREILSVAQPWIIAETNPVVKLGESLSGLVEVCYQRGPLLRAIFEAAPMDERLEKAWNDFVNVFDDTVTARIEQDQAAGLTPDFEARHVAIALNRMDIGILIHHFGRHPRSRPQPVYQSIARIWISTIYGPEVLTTFEE